MLTTTQRIDVTAVGSTLFVAYKDILTGDDGQVVESVTLRQSYTPGSDISTAPPEVHAAAAAAWTPEVMEQLKADNANAAPDSLVAMRRAVQGHLDVAAQTAGYDSIGSACSYADETAVPRYQAEGQAFRRWRSLVWDRCEELQADVEAGRRVVPDVDELIALLPALP